jgi:hypothetical protein
LFALAVRDELSHRIDALPQWEDLKRWHQQFGSADQLRADLTAIIADRTFLVAQPPVRSRDEFDQRLQLAWGRLAQTTFEVADILARTLEPRARVAQRLSGGTPRLWASSIADIREHATYLFPRSFLAHVPWERLREYPRYSVSMRERLLRLREDGSGSESSALAAISPHWKRFTAFVARAMAAHKASESDRFLTVASPQPVRGGKPALPQTRRQSQLVNADAGEWAMFPGNLPAELDAYRWRLEEARVRIFADAVPAHTVAACTSELDSLWLAIEKAAQSEDRLHQRLTKSDPRRKP